VGAVQHMTIQVKNLALFTSITLKLNLTMAQIEKGAVLESRIKTGTESTSPGRRVSAPGPHRPHVTAAAADHSRSSLHEVREAPLAVEAGGAPSPVRGAGGVL